MTETLRALNCQLKSGELAPRNNENRLIKTLRGTKPELDPPSELEDGLRSERLAYIALLIITLILELTDNYGCRAIAEVVRTAAIVYLIMNNGSNPNWIGHHRSNTAQYCCFAFIWVLIIALIVFLTILVIDREKDHYVPPNVNTTR